MIKELKLTAGMSDKEVMYIVASEWVDEICKKAVENAEEFMKNDFCRRVVFQAAEQTLRYQHNRRQVILNDFPQDKCEKDVRAYKTILYDCYFHQFGANDSHKA